MMYTHSFRILLLTLLCYVCHVDNAKNEMRLTSALGTTAMVTMSLNLHHAKGDFSRQN